MNRSLPSQQGGCATNQAFEITAQLDSAASACRITPLLRAALEALDQGLIIYGKDMRLEFLSQRVLELLDLPQGALRLGSGFARVQRAMMRSGVLTPAVLGTGVPSSSPCFDDLPQSYEWRRPDGTTLEVRHTLLPGNGCISTITDITQRRANEGKVTFLGTHDPLTGLPNRVLFHQRLDSALAAPGGVGVLACDLDRFKAVNDTYGHPVGDGLLRIISERMRGVVRRSDTVARYGGNEFAIVLAPVEDERTVDRIAQRLIAAVNEPVLIEDHRIEVELSVGSVIANQAESAQDDLFKHADLALHEAKSGGRNTHCKFRPDTGTLASTKGQLALAMKDAIRRNEFHLVYQPVVDITTGSVVSCEALMRWHHPTLGAVSPVQFIPVAEETGLIVPLGKWALNESCRQAALWPAEVRVGVNVSGLQLRRDDFEDSIVSAIATGGIEAERLKIEVTESVLIQDTDRLVACLHRLRAMGVKIALDDFGTGYSSLSYLRKFPFDKIKIDRTFISDIAHPDAAAIVRAVVGIGERLGMVIVAEGVETVDQLDRVRSEGCTEVQGYYFSRPLDERDVRAFLERGPLPVGQAAPR